MLFRSDSTVPEGPWDVRRHHRGRGGRGRVRLEERLEGFDGQQRHVSRQKDDGAGLSFENASGLQERVPCSQLLFLDHKARATVFQHVPNLVGPVADDDSGCSGGEAGGGPKDSVYQRESADRVQHLGELRLHSGPLASREDDNVDIGHVLHGYQANILV